MNFNDWYVHMYVDGRDFKFLAQVVHNELGGRRNDPYVEFDGISVGFGRNDDFDSKKMGDEDNGFIFYPIQVDIFREKPEVDFPRYLAHVNALIAVLRSQGCRVATSCDFEEWIEDDYTATRQKLWTTPWRIGRPEEPKEF